MRGNFTETLKDMAANANPRTNLALDICIFFEL